MRRARIITLSLLMLSLAFWLSAQSLGRRRAVNRPAPATTPVASPDSYSAGRGKSLTVGASTGVLANDTDPQSKPLTAVLVSTTSHGTLTLNANGGFTYVNDGSSSSTDTFSYKASNGTQESAPATVTFNISGDTPPVAVADTYEQSQSGPLTISAPGVLANDTLNNATIASYGATTGGEQNAIGGSTPTSRGGSVSLSATGGFTYTPPSSFNGSDTFKYVIQNSGGSSTATVTINVSAPATPDFFVTSPGFFYRFSGVSGDNPVLTLQRGRTYTFSVDADDIHPFQILGAPAGSVQNNNISFGIITFTVPTTAANYQYHCSLHNFGNAINTTP